MDRRACIGAAVFGAILIAAGPASPASLEARVQPAVTVVGAPAVDEAAGAASFTVRLSKASRNRVSVGFATADGSATARTDYQPRSGTLAFLPGQRSKKVRVSVLDDAEPEAEETFFLRLVRTRGARIRTTRATAIIRASDLPAPFTLHATLTGAEQLPGPGSPTGRGTATVTLDPAMEVASYTVTLSGVERPTEAGIGRGRRGDPPTTNVLRFTDEFPSSGTLVDSKRLELVEILELFRDPEGFFVEVRSATGVGSGGIRGQLTRAP